MQHGGSRGLRPQGRPPRTQVHLQAHHQLFPQRVDRRVGDLGEALFEVVVEQVGLSGEHRQGNVISHAVGGLLGRTSHVLDHQVKVFGGETEGRLLLQQLQIAQLALLGPGLGRQAAAMLGQPGAVGVARRHFSLDIPIAQQPALLQIHGQHLAGAEPALFDNPTLLELHDPGFRAHHHKAVVGDAVAGRAQAVAIQGGPHAAAIGEHQQGRTIPGLLGAGGVFIEGLDLRPVGELGLVAEGLGHQREQALGDRPAAAHQQLQGGVEVGRVAEGGIDHRLEIPRRLPPDGVEIGLRGPGPVEIAQQGIYFAVVAQQAHRLGQGPAGQGVGAEAAVIHREAHRKAWIAQVAVEGCEHLGAHHGLVDHRATAQGGEVELAGRSSPDGPRPVAATAAQAKQQGLEGIPLQISRQQPLGNRRGGLASQGAEHLWVERHLSPAQTAQPQPGSLPIAEFFGFSLFERISGQKHHGQPPGAATGSGGLGPYGLEIAPWDATQHPRSVAGITVAAAAAAVLHAVQAAQGLGQHPVAGLATEAGQKSHAAGILLPRHSLWSRAVAMGPNGARGMRHNPSRSGS